MSITVTLVLLAASLSLAVFANWRERRERPLGKAPLISYPAIQMVGVVFSLLLLGHLVTLMTGHQLHGRFMP